LPINDEIKSNKVRLIGAQGEQLGIVPLKEALIKAKESSLDLVQMAKEGDPLVCKLMDHGKHIFDRKKAEISIQEETEEDSNKGN